MKISRVAQVFLAMSNIICSQAQLSETKPNLRRTTPAEMHEVEYKDECTVVVQVDENGKFELLCLENSGVAYKIEAATSEFIENEIEAGNLISGKSIASLGEGCTLINGSTIQCPQLLPNFINGDQEFKESVQSHGNEELTNRRGLDQSQENENRKLGTLATQSVLVVQVIASNSAAASTIAELEEEVFNDAVNLKTIFNTCSHGKLTIVKAADRTGISTNIVNGVVEITVTDDVTLVDETVLRNSVINKLNEEFSVQSADELADHVMICQPTHYNFLAYAWSNSWMSSYGTVGQDSWCTKPGAAVHEIGHNLGLAHAGELADNYGDTTGMMGYTDDIDDGPVKCFNPPNYVQLGWFTNKVTTLSAAHDLPWSGTVIGINEYTTAEGNIAVVITKASHEDDKYIGFNGAQGININTGEANNQVTVTKKSVGVESGGTTFLEAKLGVNSQFVFENYLNSLALEMSVTDVNTVLGTAQVSVALAACTSNTDCFDDDPECDVCVNGQCRWDTDNCAGRIQLNVRTDNYPQETSIVITNECTQETVLNKSDYTGPDTLYNDFFNGVAEHQYSITFTDAYSDGICCGHGSGYYEIEFNGEVVIHSAPEGASETTYFGAESCGPTTPPLPATPNPTAAPVTPSPITPNPTAAPVTPSPTSFPTPNPTSPPSTTPECIADNGLCSLGTCCSDICETSGKESNRVCLAGTGTGTGTCLAVGYTCSDNSDCCSNKCRGNSCKS